MFLVAGLGNPGRQYLNSRHNVGFVIVDLLQSHFNFSYSTSAKFNAELASGTFNKHKVLLAKPLTYMNLSGNALNKICSYYKISIENLIVVHDDIDLPFGAIRFKQGGSSSGHNGLKSIDDCLGNNYHRIRIGVGRPDNPNIEVADYVLGNFTKSEEDYLKKIGILIIDNFGLIFDKKFEEFKRQIAP